jgi:hypothetical protein
MTMPISESNALGQEWITLQNNFEQYEKGALLIKLLAVVLCSVGLALALHEVLLAVLLAVLWLQEGIFRTYQARLGVRILRIEQTLKRADADEIAAFQLHSEWRLARPETIDLLAEYGASAMRPTVAFPYVVLLCMIVLLVTLTRP